MPTFNDSLSFGFGAGVSGCSITSGSTTAGEDGLLARRPDWPKETIAQLESKPAAMTEAKKREKDVVYDMGFKLGRRTSIL